MNVHTLARQAGCAAAVLAAWQVLSASGLTPSGLLPLPTEVAGQLVELIGGATLWTAVGHTGQGAVQGLAAACLVAIPLGLVAGLSGFVERSLRAVMDFGRAFPAIALTPVLLLLFGTKSTTTTVVVFAACIFPLFIQTLYGARRIEPSIVETVRSYRIPLRLYFLRVALPSATPSIMTGLRLAVSTALLVAVATEVVAGVPGLGQQLSMAQQDGAPALAYAYIVVAGVIGLVVIRGAEALEAYFLRWRPRD